MEKKNICIYINVQQIIVLKEFAILIHKSNIAKIFLVSFYVEYLFAWLKCLFPRIGFGAKECILGEGIINEQLIELFKGFIARNCMDADSESSHRYRILKGGNYGDANDMVRMANQARR